MLIIGILALENWLSSIELALQCEERWCASVHYPGVLLGLWLLVPFPLLAATRGNVPSRRLLRNGWVVGGAVGFILVIVFTIWWFASDGASRTCEALTHDQWKKYGWSCAGDWNEASLKGQQELYTQA